MALLASRDPALEAHVLWHRFKREIFSLIVIVILAIIGFGGYWLYTERPNSTGSPLVAEAKNAQDYEQGIAPYSSTPPPCAPCLPPTPAQPKNRKLMAS